MFGLKLLTIALAVGCQGFDISLPEGQSVLDIDIHIGSKTNEMQHGSPTINAEKAQYPSGLVSALSIPGKQAFFVAGVGAGSRARATQYYGGWKPGYKSYYDFGGNFNRSLAIYLLNDTIYLAGTTMGGNLVLKYFRPDTEAVYPKSFSWIFLEEGIVGTPAIADHDGRRLSVVVKKTDGSLVHKIYDPETDEQSDGSIPSKSFDSNPALLKRPGYLVVFARAADGTLHMSEMGDDGKWSSWTDLGGKLVGDPATKWNLCKGDVFSVGKDGGVYARYFQESGKISDWLSISGTKALGTGAIHYYGPHLDKTLFYYQAEDTIKWVRREGDKLIYSGTAEGSTPAAPAVFWYDHSGTRYSDVFVIGMGGELWRRQRDLAKGWTAWENLGWKFKI